MRIFLEAGVAPRQLAVGVPFYGRGYGAVAAPHDGLLQKADYSAAGEWGTGGIDYRVLMSKQPERFGFRRHWQAEAQVPWLYNPATGYGSAMTIRSPSSARPNMCGGGGWGA